MDQSRRLILWLSIIAIIEMSKLLTGQQFLKILIKSRLNADLVLTTAGSTDKGILAAKDAK